MRLLQVLSSLDPALGGPVEAVRQLSTELAARGHSIHVLTFDHRDRAPREQVAGVEVTGLGRKGVVRTGGSPGFAFEPSAIEWIRNHATEFDAALIHGLWQFHGIAVSRGLRRARVPYAVFTHGMLDPWFKRAYPAKHAKKLVYWFLAERSILNRAGAVFFTCEEERRLARESFPGYHVNEVVLGYGITAPDLDPARQTSAFAARLPDVANRRFLLHLSRIHPKKGLDLLLDAAASSDAFDCADLDIVVAGPDGGAWEESLRASQAAVSLGDRLHWAGPLYGDEKWGALLRSDAFVLPSHQENFGIVIAESLATQTPVLIAHGVNIWREVVQGDAGIAFDDTLKDVRAGLERWLQLPASERDRMGENGRRLFEVNFEVSRVAERLEDALTNLIQRTQGQRVAYTSSS